MLNWRVIDSLTETLVILHVRRQRRLWTLRQQNHSPGPWLNRSIETWRSWCSILPHPLPQSQSVLHAKVLKVGLFQVMRHRGKEIDKELGRGEDRYINSFLLVYQKTYRDRRHRKQVVLMSSATSCSRGAVLSILGIGTLVTGKQQDPVEGVEQFRLCLSQTLQVFHPDRRRTNQRCLDYGSSCWACSVVLPVVQQSSGTVHDMRQGRLDEPPSGNRLEGGGEGGREPELNVLHEHLFKGLQQIGIVEQVNWLEQVVVMKQWANCLTCKSAIPVG